MLESINFNHYQKQLKHFNTIIKQYNDTPVEKRQDCWSLPDTTIYIGNYCWKGQKTYVYLQTVPEWSKDSLETLNEIDISKCYQDYKKYYGQSAKNDNQLWTTDLHWIVLEESNSFTNSYLFNEWISTLQENFNANLLSFKKCIK